MIEQAAAGKFQVTRIAASNGRTAASEAEKGIGESAVKRAEATGMGA